MAALQGLKTDRVCHICSQSKRLAPAVRIGWLLSPSWLTGSLTYGLALSAVPGTVEQLALAAFLARGELDRHLRRTRLALRERREVAVEAVTAAIPGARAVGIPAGLHALFLLAPDRDAETVQHAAARRGVAVETCAAGWDGEPCGGLIVGFANLSGPALHRAVAELRAAVEATG